MCQIYKKSIGIVTTIWTNVDNVSIVSEKYYNILFLAM